MIDNEQIDKIVEITRASRNQNAINLYKITCD